MTHASTSNGDIGRISFGLRESHYNSHGPLTMQIPESGQLSMPCQEIFACGHARWRDDISWAAWYARNKVVPILPRPSSAVIASPQRAYHFYTTSTCGRDTCYRRMSLNEDHDNGFHVYSAQEAKSVDLIRNELDRLRMAFLGLGGKIRRCEVQAIAEVEHVGLEDCGIQFRHSEECEDSSDVQLGYDLPELVDIEICLARLEAAIEVGTPRIFYDVARGKALEKLQQLSSKLTALEIFTNSLQALEKELQCRGLIDALPRSFADSTCQSPAPNALPDIDKALERESLAMAIFRPDISTWQAACETMSEQARNHFDSAMIEHPNDRNDNTRLVNKNHAGSKKPRKGVPEPLQKIENLHERAEFKTWLPQLEHLPNPSGNHGRGPTSASTTKADAANM